MEYQKYMDLGFERSEMNDNVEYRKTGYYGYTLEKKINLLHPVCVSSGELDKPKLYIKKINSDTYHIIPITPEVVVALFTEPVDYMYKAC